MLCGQLDSHLRQMEQRLGISIFARGNQFTLSGPAVNVAAGNHVEVFETGEADASFVPFTESEIDIEVDLADCSVRISERPDFMPHLRSLTQALADSRVKDIKLIINNIPE